MVDTGASPEGPRVLGIDAAGRFGWVGVALDATGVRSVILGPTVAGLIAEAEATLGGSLAAIGVDIPVGLVAAPTRSADVAARAYVGPRRSSVFPAPHPDVLELTNYAEVNRRLVALGVPRMSRQGFGLFGRIREVAALAADPRIIEAFPEASFTAMADGTPPAFAKKTWGGLRERLDRLAAASPSIEVPAAVGAASAAGADDVLDAAACAWSAWRFALGRAVPLGDDTEVDAVTGRRVAVWC